MKTAEQIIAEAPLVQVLDDVKGKLALCCSSCPWWTNDARKAKSADDTFCCPACNSGLRELPLEDLIAQTREENAVNFEAFIKCFSDNKHQEEKE